MTRATLAIPLLAAGFAQTPAFETASIKPSPPETRCGTIEPLPGGGLRIECLALKTILTWAYDVQDYQVSGGPSWAASERWNILAKPAASDNSPDGPAEYEKMNGQQRADYMHLVRRRLQSLLAEQFRLVLRHEIREQTAYALTVAKSGPKMKESAPGMIKRRPGQIVSKGVRIETLAQFLGVDIGRPVADRTGLSGIYEFTLDWTPDRPASAAPGIEAASDPTGPTIFTAIEEQLGLRLESRKMPVDTLVIDRVEKPSGN
jgi:bla regulator protein blaR1